MLKSRGGREENEKLLLSVKETCGLTGLSERTVRTLMAENDFTAVPHNFSGFRKPRPKSDQPDGRAGRPGEGRRACRGDAG